MLTAVAQIPCGRLDIHNHIPHLSIEFKDNCIRITSTDWYRQSFSVAILSSTRTRWTCLSLFFAPLSQFFPLDTFWAPQMLPECVNEIVSREWFYRLWPLECPPNLPASGAGFGMITRERIDISVKRREPKAILIARLELQGPLLCQEVDNHFSRETPQSCFAQRFVISSKSNCVDKTKTNLSWKFRFFAFVFWLFTIYWNRNSKIIHDKIVRRNMRFSISLFSFQYM